jgi:DNA-binding beta-propeller fold protein YncE
MGRQQWQVINPAGTQVNLGIRVRAKAVALNPNLKTHTAAVLTMGTSADDGNGAVEVFDTKTGLVLQNYVTFGVDSSGSYGGIAYSADGNYLVFSQDSSNVTVAKVNAQGLLEDDAQISVPPLRCLRRALQRPRPDRSGQPGQGREASRHGHDSGSLCAELSRARRCH